MPRTARVKSGKAVFHIMIRSISEIDLFKNDKDKYVYLSIMKKYQILYHFKVYAYCLMNNHGHFIIYANGADISKIMHSINLSYARYFNKTYKRHGHLFQDRFKSRIITSNRYLRVLLTYIHNNPEDINGYRNHPERYKFSSLPVFLKFKRDTNELLDMKFINKFLKTNGFIKMSNINISSSELELQKNLQQDAEFLNESSGYVNNSIPLIRNFNESSVINFVSEKFGVLKCMLFAKNNREVHNSKAILVFLLRSYCNYTCIDVCKTLGNITQSMVSSLTKTAVSLIKDDYFYQNIVEEFLSKYGTAI